MPVITMINPSTLVQILTLSQILLNKPTNSTKRNRSSLSKAILTLCGGGPRSNRCNNCSNGSSRVIAVAVVAVAVVSGVDLSKNLGVRFSQLK